MRKILAILLLASLAVLVVPQLALAMEHGQTGNRTGNTGNQSHDNETGDNHNDTSNNHADKGGNENENGNQHGVNASFMVRLVGSEQVPKVNTTAFGFAKVELIGNTTLEFSLVVCDIANVTHAHIHVGAAGTNGPIVIPFFDEPSYPFSTEGCATLAAGIRTPSDLMTNSEASVSNWNGFVHALLTNDTYINVHTTAHSGGEIRGQLILHAQHEQGQDHDDGQQIEQGDAETNDD